MSSRYGTEGKFTDEDDQITFGPRAGQGGDPSVSLLPNTLFSLDRFLKTGSEFGSRTKMKQATFTPLREVELDAIPSNKIIFGRIGDKDMDGQLLRDRCYNAFFILNDTIEQDLSVYRRPSRERTTKSVDDNIFDVGAISSVNPFKNTTISQFNDIVSDEVMSLSRQISLDDNSSDYIQTFKKDANVSPEDYKKLKVRKSFSNELRGLNRKRSTGV